MNPCEHYTTGSSVTGLDAEGVCLTCGTEWGTDDIRAANTRARSHITTHCPYCSDRHRVSAADVYVLTNGDNGHALFHDCPICGNEVATPVTPENELLLRRACVRFTTTRPITPAEITAYLAVLDTADDLAGLARRMSA